MTPQKAIKVLRLNIIFSPQSDVFREAAELAISALEKTIPKKAVDYDGKIIVGLCPDCEAVVTSDFCDNCGQALDWSESE